MDKIRIYIALLFCLTLSFIPPVLAQDTSGSNSNRYNTQYSYDCMGNITSLSRNGLLDDGSYGLIDDLTLTYDGNQLMAVSDDGDDPSYNNAWNFMDGSDSEIEYEYDANGNVTKDLNRNILSIQYNTLNLPSVIDLLFLCEGPPWQQPYGGSSERNCRAGKQLLSIRRIDVKQYWMEHSTLQVQRQGV